MEEFGVGLMVMVYLVYDVDLGLRQKFLVSLVMLLVFCFRSQTKGLYELFVLCCFFVYSLAGYLGWYLLA